MMDKLVFTCGDINGIGPEIVIKTLNKLSSLKAKSIFYFAIPENVFQKVIKLVKPAFTYEVKSDIKTIESNKFVTVIALPAARLKTGFATRESGAAAFGSLKLSFSLLKKGFADAVVTAPVSKTAIRLAGIKFPGQTELFAHWSGASDYMMMFVSDKINVALATIHVPLNSVASFISKEYLIKKLNLIKRTLNIDFGISNPKAAVLGINPHAGEGGLIGKEESKEILPAVKAANNFMSVEGPFPPDAFFASRSFVDFDITLGMYHDQVLIPFKYLNKGKGVNYTAGLPVIRTSPDHGVAYDISWKGIADNSSLLQAVKVAKKIIKNRKKYAETGKS
jgi:4-hydroxythreonine-4-phosphate dehydrogenase